MRGCTEYPKELNHGSDCIYGSAMPGSPIGRICYCDTGDGCNTGDVETTVPPTITTPKNNGATKFCINMFQILGFLLIVPLELYFFFISGVSIMIGTTLYSSESRK